MSKALKGIQSGEKNPMWGRKASEETRHKLSESHKGIQSGENHPMWGKKHSEKTRQKMQKSHSPLQVGEGHPLSDMAILEQKLEAFCSNIQTPPYRKEVVDNG
jgi:hypothetical protein